MKKIVVVAAIFVALCLCMAPVSSRDVIDNVPTIYIGEEHLNLKFLEGRESKLFGWWKPGSSVLTVGPEKTINLENYNDVSFPISEFNGYDGRWFPLDSNCVLNQTAYPFILANPVVTITPTIEPTPVPTPSTGNIVIS